MPATLPRPKLLWGGGGGRIKKVKEESGAGGRCQSSYMHIFQLMLTTYLCCIFNQLSESLRNNPFSLPEEFKKENKNLKYLDICILQTSKHSRALAKECSGAFFPPFSTLWVSNTDDSTRESHARYGRGFWGCLIFLSCYSKHKRRFFPGLSVPRSLGKTVITTKGMDSPTFRWRKNKRT